jgi:hypothetical protein
MNTNVRMELWERCIDVWKQTAEKEETRAQKIDALGRRVFLLPDGSGETTAAHSSKHEKRDGMCLYYAPGQAFREGAPVNRTNTTTLARSPEATRKGTCHALRSVPREPGSMTGRVDTSIWQTGKTGTSRRTRPCTSEY